MRVAGDPQADRAVVLLHGLVGSGDAFGADYDRLVTDHRLVVPDLLGFARSVDRRRQDHSLDAHLAALDEMAADVLGTDGIRMPIAGHSMGGLLALHWAARRARPVERVVTWGAPLYRNQAEARRHIKALGPREALFALEGPTARLVCKLMCCAQPLAAGWLAVAMNPQVPIPLARRGSQHTWESYLGGMQGIIVRGRWQQALKTLEYAGVPVTLAAGRADPVPVAGLAQTLAETHTALTVATHPTATHALPLSDPKWCIAQATGEQ